MQKKWIEWIQKDVYLSRNVYRTESIALSSVTNLRDIAGVLIKTMENQFLEPQHITLLQIAPPQHTDCLKVRLYEGSIKKVIL